MKLSVVIPVYNEKESIQALLSAVSNVQLPGWEKEIIVVEDYSTDGTRELLKAYQDKYRVLFHDKNKGKGAALRTGFSAATGDYVLVQDADLEYDPEEYSTLLEPVLKYKADVVYGSRFIGDRAHRVVYFWHYLGNRFLTLLSNMFTNLNLTDMETCYKLFRREIIQKITLEQDRFGFDPEITAKVARLKPIKIFEVGISYNGRTYSEGKKITWKDGFRVVYCIIKYGIYRT
ncbi:MAG TPA: glycosyltransferase family 2 protein [Candidatus Kapabacteria bacterium]|nr:glycosyltransferase family 2 protein [Candidatus Kapabacteria bacterium]